MDNRYISKINCIIETEIVSLKSVSAITEYFSDNDFYIIDSVIFDKYNFHVKHFYIVKGEEDKEFSSVLKIIEKLYLLNFPRTSKIWGIGGGSTTDITGFVASIFKRGLETVFVPTTLLAMADSSYGGKNGVNYYAKNIIGTFHMPRKIYLCDEFLKSDKRNLIDQGFSELIKVAFLKGGKLLADLKRGESLNSDMILESLRIKSSYCVEDFYDNKDIRIFLNWGHTVGHALERCLNLSHGTAVAEGLIIEQNLAFVSGYTVYDGSSVGKVLDNYGFKSIFSDIGFRNDFIEMIKVDKKNREDKIRIVYLKDEGKPGIMELSVVEITNYMENLV